MTAHRFVALPSDRCQALWDGAPDANGQPPERHISDGGGNPCRHCLRHIPEGDAMLVLAYRPFPAPQPYAEFGPVFLHAEPCQRHPETPGLPPMIQAKARILVRGYRDDDRIKYGTGQVVATADLDKACATLLDDPELAYLHLRSAANNCFQCRVERA